MQEETLAELLRSPLDDDGSSLRLPTWLLALVAGLVIGGLLAVGWIAARGGDGVVAIAGTTTPSAQRAEPAPFPQTHVAVNDQIALHPVAIYEQGGNSVVVLSSIGPVGVPPEEVMAFPGGIWELRDVEARSIADSREIRNPQALGTTAVSFRSDQASRPRTLVLTPLTNPEVITASIPVDLPGFPFVTGRSFEISLAADLRLFGILLQLDENAGVVDWGLRGADGFAQVDFAVTLPETAADGGEATVMLSEHIAPPYPFQRQRLPRPTPVSSRIDVLRRSGPEIADPGSITRAVIDVTVYLYRAQEDAIVEIDLAGITG